MIPSVDLRSGIEVVIYAEGIEPLPDYGNVLLVGDGNRGSSQIDLHTASYQGKYFGNGRIC